VLKSADAILRSTTVSERNKNTNCSENNFWNDCLEEKCLKKQWNDYNNSGKGLMLYHITYNFI